MDIGIVRYNPLNGSSWIELPESIQNSESCINVQNEDEKCLVWAIRSALANIPHDSRPERVQHYIPNEHKDLNMNGIEFPAEVNSFKKIEEQNEGK